MGDRQRARLHLRSAFPHGFAALTELGAAVDAAGLEPRLVELVRIRASQLNGCDSCLDLHLRRAADLGETDERVRSLAGWREAGEFSPRERAALELTEAVTLVAGRGVDDGQVAAARLHFDEAELVRLVFVIAHINAWNRLAITAGSPVAGGAPAPSG
ncbi:MAG: carboxymuconolactone decarboxylase family protein [Candidatus Dormibacteria bacterium]